MPCSAARQTFKRKPEATRKGFQRKAWLTESEAGSPVVNLAAARAEASRLPPQAQRRTS